MKVWQLVNALNKLPSHADIYIDPSEDVCTEFEVELSESTSDGTIVTLVPTDD